MKKICFHQDMRTRERLMIINKTGMSDMNLFSKCIALTNQRKRFQYLHLARK